MIKNPSRVRATQDREAAEESRSPVILQASAGARKYAGEAYLRHMVLATVESHPTNPLVLHQDHDASLVVCTQSIRSGFTSGVRKVNIDTEAFGCAGHTDRMRPVPLEAMVKRYH